MVLSAPNVATTSNSINNPVEFADYVAGGSVSTLWNVYETATDQNLNSYWLTVQGSAVANLDYK